MAHIIYKVTIKYRSRPLGHTVSIREVLTLIVNKNIYVVRNINKFKSGPFYTAIPYIEWTRLLAHIVALSYNDKMMYLQLPAMVGGKVKSSPFAELERYFSQPKRYNFKAYCMTIKS